MAAIDSDDVILIRRVAERDSEALSALYDRYHRLVFSVAIHILHDEAAAEDVTLDTFIRIWEKADTYRPEQASLSTWLTSIARNRSIDLLRRRDARPNVSPIDWFEFGSALPANGPTPEEATAQAMRRARIQAAVAQLPENQREALALAFFEGYTHREIAEKLDQPLGTIKTRIRLAMLKLRETLADDWGGSP